MLKKRIALSAALLAFVMGITACSGEKAPVQSGDEGTEVSANENSGAASGGKINFWLDKLGESEKIQAITDVWSANSDVEVAIQNYPDTAAYQTAMQQAIDSPEGPGMFTWWSGSQLETLAKNGKIEDLTAEWDSYIANGVSADIKDAFTIDGKAYAAPYSVLYNVILYNKEAFTKAGITEEPKTFDEFLSACEKLKAAGITPIGLKNDSWASFIWFQQMLGSYDPQLYIDVCSGAKKYTDPDVVKVMEIWKDMFDKGYFAKPIGYMDNYKSLAQGTSAMILEPSTTVTDLVQNFGLVSGETIDVMSLPSMSGKKSVIYFEASPICVSTASKEKDNAKTALSDFFKKDTQNELLTQTGIANTSQVELNDPSIGKTVQMAADSANYQLILRYYENTPEDLRNYALDELSRFMYSGAPIDEVLGNIQKIADEAFAK